ncbi:MAG: PAS domain-containing protein [Verrucomicrobia bacterium]|nr:PAS domain-containing protein [Verrucomicrobiota bacterium]
MFTRLQGLLGALGQNEVLEIRFFRLVCLAAGVLCLAVVLPTNLLQNLSWVVHVAGATLGAGSLLCYRASLRGRHLTVGYLVGTVLLLDLAWFWNAGSEGSLAYYFFVVVLYPFGVFRGGQRWTAVGLLTLNVWLLFLVEWWFPQTVVPFDRRADRWIDLMAGVGTVVLAMSLILWLILHAHDHERQRLKVLAGELAASERNYREIFNATNDALFIHDEGGRVLDLNERACAEFRCERAAVLGGTVERLSLGEPPFALAQAEAHLARAVREGPQVFVWRCRRGDGGLFWAEVALRVGEVGGRRCVIAAVRNIDDRMRAEAELRLQEARTRLALAAGNQGWFDINPATGEGTASAEYARMIGLPAEELKVTVAGWLAGVHPDDQAGVQRAFQECLAGEAAGTMEYRRQDSRGGWRWIRSIGRVIERDAGGRAIRMIGTHTDVTGRRELEATAQQGARLQAVATLANGVAHDLNNILAPMLLAGGLLRGRLADPADRELMTGLENGARRGAAIVKQLMTFSRQMVPRPGPMDLAALVAESVRALREAWPPEFRVQDRVETGLWPVNADRVQLRQVIANLAANAREAMPTGGTLTIGAANVEIGEHDAIRSVAGGCGRFVMLTVGDTGRGIAAEDLGRIFDPFFTTKEIGQGSGLGLAVVHGIVKGHGGAITVQSEPGRGATLRVLLPAAA